MRKLAFFAPFAATIAFAGIAAAEPATVNVTIGHELQRDAENLGAREVQEQVDRLTWVLQSRLADSAELEGARIDLVLTDLKPNRPTMEQLVKRPGLDPLRSRSIGGAAVEGTVVLADGSTRPVRYDWFSPSLADVQGSTTWTDADRAYERLARNLANGRYTVR
ncbi:hypothetical protein GCM10009422_14110 [Brevundimonas kwangchunensis]|uniref:Uncharacterized protein n=1 Tax=Brevundimonas kwangchunensis TaxID=322163 RepID=A0ABN1GU95_9CAUL